MGARRTFHWYFSFVLCALVSCLDSYGKPLRIVVEVLSNLQDGYYKSATYEHYEIQEDGSWKLVLVEGNYGARRERPLLPPTPGVGLPKEVTDQINGLLDPKRSWSIKGQEGEYIISGKDVSEAASVRYPGGREGPPPSLNPGLSVVLGPDTRVERVSGSLIHIEGTPMVVTSLAEREGENLVWKIQESEESKSRVKAREIRPDHFEWMRRHLERLDKDSDIAEKDVAQKILRRFDGKRNVLQMMGKDSEASLSASTVIKWARKQVEEADRVKELRLLVATDRGVQPAQIKFHREEPLIIAQGVPAIPLPSQLFRHYQQSLGRGGPEGIVWGEPGHENRGSLRHFLVDTRLGVSPYWVAVQSDQNLAVLLPGKINADSSGRPRHQFNSPYPSAAQCKVVYEQLKQLTERR